MTRLAGQVALVTHAGSGIGAAVARRLAAEGARVVIGHDGDTEGASRLVADIIWRGGCAIAIDADIAHWPDVRRLFDAIDTTFGRLDILVNDTRDHDTRDTARTPTDERRRDEINLFGAMLACQEAIRLFGPDGGAIINLISLARCSLAPDNDNGPDTAIDALTLGLARAFGTCKIRVHAIAPDLPESCLPGPQEAETVAKRAADLAWESGRAAPLMTAG